MGVVYVVFTAIYGATGSVMQVVHTSTGVKRIPSRAIMDWATFSLLAMSTSGNPATGLEPRNSGVHLLTGLQAFLGIALTGLLGYVVGNRIRR